MAGPRFIGRGLGVVRAIGVAAVTIVAPDAAVALAQDKEPPKKN